MHPFAIFTLLCSLVLFPFIDGWAFSTLWRWFLVPLGAPNVPLFHAMGLDLAVSVLFIGLVGKQSTKTKTEDEQFDDAVWLWWKRVVVVFMVGTGAVYRLFL